MMNPQIRFGEDLMSRVSYVMMNPGGDRELTDLHPRRAQRADHRAVAARPMHRPTSCSRSCIVGNPIMHHIVARHRPDAARPGAVHARHRRGGRARRRSISASRFPTARAYVGPCIAGHVGADTAAAMLAEGPHRGERWQLLVDVGTNAEIVLGCSQRQFAASSPTGPAFEGAQISCGQRATAGAIERVRIDRATLEPRFKVIGCDLWSDDPGFAAATEHLDDHRRLRLGHHRGDRRDVPRRRDRHRRRGPRRTGRHLRRTSSPTAARSATCCTAATTVELSITQNDVRAIQLAKAALRAGIDLLMDHAGVDTLGDMRLAGAFGAHIDPLYALVLGLVPDCPGRGRALGRQRRRRRRGAGAALDAGRGPRWKRRSAAWSRSRRPPSRSSRSCSWRRWRSRTRPRRHRTSPRWSPFPNEAHQSMPPGAVDAADRRTGHDATDAPSTTPAHRPTQRRTCRPPSAARLARRRGRVPYLTRTMKPFEIVSDEGSRDHRAQRRHDPRGGRRRDPRLPVGAAGLRRRRCASRRHPGALPTRACAARSCRPARRASTCSTPATRRTNVQIGGDATVFAPNYGSPFVLRPRQRPPLRDARRLPELRQARVPVAVPAPLRRHRVRAGRRPGQQAPPRHGVHATSATATSRSWARSPRPAAPRTPSSWPASRFGGDLADRTVMTSLINASSPLVWDGTMLGAAEVYALQQPGDDHHARSSSPGRWRRRRRPASPRRRSPSRWPA